jgi:hypothetical protein
MASRYPGSQTRASPFWGKTPKSSPPPDVLAYSAISWIRARFYREQFPDEEDGGSMPDEENEER